MIFIPIGTDAPIYHRPIATVGLILANCACFALTGAGDPQLTEPWILHFGSLNPIEWLSSMFAHASFGHLAGNMLFLWTFGLLVEGKIGSKKMFGLYMLIGLVQAAFIQVIMLPWPVSGALGASSAIYGLMAICLIWAPKNDVIFFYFFWFWTVMRTGTTGFLLMYVALFYLGVDLISFVTLDQGMGTAALHLSGAMFGLTAGIVFLKKEWVDCENWDLFRVLSGNYGRFADPTTTVGSHADPQLMFGTRDVAVSDDLPDTGYSEKHKKRMQQIASMVKQGQLIEASDELLNFRMENSDAGLSEPLLKKLAIGLMRAEMPEESEIYLEEYIERFPEQCGWARVRLAGLMLHNQKRPAAALALLKKLRLSEVAPEQQTMAKKIVVTAKQQVRAGVKDAEPQW